jgi:hypothetical protein
MNPPQAQVPLPLPLPPLPPPPPPPLVPMSSTVAPDLVWNGG